MTVVRVVDADDLRVADYRNLTDVGLRKRWEPEHGLFMAESHQVIERALGAGYPVRSVLTTERWLDAVEQLTLPDDTPVFVGDEVTINAITGYRVHRGALAAMSRLPLPSVDEIVDGARRLVILEGIVDHTNVGAIFRSAAGLGFGAVLVDPTCADPLYRRSVRVSMGAVFAVPWTRLSTWPGGLERLKATGWTIVALTPGVGALDLDEFRSEEHANLAVILGTEGDGISAGAQALTDYRVRIPMAAGVDSLNVAAAAAVTFYATR